MNQIDKMQTIHAEGGPHGERLAAILDYLRMISAQTRSAFVARENRSPLFRIMRY
jgi:hypothetical protein